MPPPPIKSGKICQFGTFSELVGQTNGAFAKMMKEIQSHDNLEEKSEEIQPIKMKRQLSFHVPQSNKNSAKAKLIEDEERELGSVKWDVYFGYIRACGKGMFSVMIFCYVLGQTTIHPT